MLMRIGAIAACLALVGCSVDKKVAPPSKARTVVEVVADKLTDGLGGISNRHHLNRVTLQLVISEATYRATSEIRISDPDGGGDVHLPVRNGALQYPTAEGVYAQAWRINCDDWACFAPILYNPLLMGRQPGKERRNMSVALHDADGNSIGGFAFEGVDVPLPGRNPEPLVRHDFRYDQDRGGIVVEVIDWPRRTQAEQVNLVLEYSIGGQRHREVKEFKAPTSPITHFHPVPSGADKIVVSAFYASNDIADIQAESTLVRDRRINP